jgi:hypothetical protein
LGEVTVEAAVLGALFLLAMFAPPFYAGSLPLQDIAK